MDKHLNCVIVSWSESVLYKCP